MDKLDVQFADMAMPQPVLLQLESPQFVVSNLVCSLDQPSAQAQFGGTVHLPGIVREVRVQGRAAPFAGSKTFDVRVDAAGVNPTALEPYLNAAGLTSDITGMAQRFAGGVGRCIAK